MFMGYSSTQKGYRLYDLHSHFLMSRRVIFQEDLFPFRHMKAATTPIFPVLDLLYPVVLDDTRQAPGVSPLPPESQTIQPHHMESPATTLHMEFPAHSTEAHEINTEQLSTAQPSLDVPPSPELRRSSRPSRPPL